MRERAKLYKVQKNKTHHILSKRLNAEEEKQGDMQMEVNEAQKRKRGQDGKALPVSGGSKPSSQQNA